MKQTFYISTILVLLTACNQNGSLINHLKHDSVTTGIMTDTLIAEKKNERKIVNDSLIFTYDSLFAELNLDLIEISKKQFLSYSNKFRIGCEVDSGQFIKGSGIYVHHDCNEICETYLCEKATNRKMIMPSAYDAGILSILFSPSCSQLMISSSYDGPDFGEYYNHRAEIFIFNVTTGNGLFGIKPTLKFYTKDWSIEKVIWISESEIAFKTYEESRTTTNQDNLNYKYIKTKLK